MNTFHQLILKKWRLIWKIFQFLWSLRFYDFVVFTEYVYMNFNDNKKFVFLEVNNMVWNWITCRNTFQACWGNFIMADLEVVHPIDM